MTLKSLPMKEFLKRSWHCVLRFVSKKNSYQAAFFTHFCCMVFNAALLLHSRDLYFLPCLPICKKKTKRQWNLPSMLPNYFNYRGFTRRLVLNAKVQFASKFKFSAVEV